MKLIPISSITIPPNRQRQEFNAQALLELRESIEAYGLLHPIVIREVGEERFLVAGERRLRAIADMHTLGAKLFCGTTLIAEGYVAAISLGELTPLAAEEAELEENVRRVDLTWQERSTSIAKLHHLRDRQSRIAGNIGQPLRATALEVHGRGDGSYQDDIRRSVILARHLDKPEVASAKSVGEAYKALKRIEAGEERVALALSVGATLTRHSHSIHLADSIEWMAAQEPGQFDVILTDPPYGMNAHEFGDGAGRLVGSSHSYNDAYDPTWVELMCALLEHAYRLAKPQAHLYLFCDIDRFHELRRHAARQNWWVHRTPIINYKPDGNRVPWPEHGPRRQWEMLLYAVKGKKSTISIQSDVITTRMKEEAFGHGAQKPVELYQDLLKRSCRPGDRVLDPFAGTGTIFPAAHGLKLIATGIERDQEYYGICLKRLEGL